METSETTVTRAGLDNIAEMQLEAAQHKVPLLLHDDSSVEAATNLALMSLVSEGSGC